VAKTNGPATRSGAPRGDRQGQGRQREPFLGSNRVDRVLGGMFIGVMAISVIAFFVLMVGGGTGMLNDSNTSLYGIILVIPFVGLPLAIVLLIVLTVRMAMERRRANRD